MDLKTKNCESISIVPSALPCRLRSGLHIDLIDALQVTVHIPTLFIIAIIIHIHYALEHPAMHNSGFYMTRNHA